MKKFCTSWRENATNVTNFEKKKILRLTRKELKLHQDTTDTQKSELRTHLSFLIMILINLFCW